MLLWQAEKEFRKPLCFGAQWQIEARDLLRIRADIERLQRELVRWSCSWDDLPFKGEIYFDKDAEQLAVLRDMYREQASVADFPERVRRELEAEGILG